VRLEGLSKLNIMNDRIIRGMKTAVFRVVTPLSSVEIHLCYNPEDRILLRYRCQKLN
jgi:hypothetical protein